MCVVKLKKVENSKQRVGDRVSQGIAIDWQKVAKYFKYVIALVVIAYLYCNYNHVFDILG